MVKVKCWVLYLISFETDKIEFYYNHVEDKFDRQFNIQCAFLDEKSCLEKGESLSIVGLESGTGTMDYPRELLVEIITDAFYGNGII